MLLSFDPPLLSGGLKLPIPFFENLLLSAVEFVGRRDIPDGAVQPDGVVILDVLCHKPSGVVKGKRCLHSDALPLDRFMEPLKFAV